MSYYAGFSLKKSQLDQPKYSPFRQKQKTDFSEARFDLMKQSKTKDLQQSRMSLISNHKTNLNKESFASKSQQNFKKFDLNKKKFQDNKYNNFLNKLENQTNKRNSFSFSQKSDFKNSLNEKNLFSAFQSNKNQKQSKSNFDEIFKKPENSNSFVFNVKQNQIKTNNFQPQSISQSNIRTYNMPEIGAIQRLRSEIQRNPEQAFTVSDELNKLRFTLDKAIMYFRS